MFSFLRRGGSPRRDLLTVALEQTLDKGTCVLCHLLQRREYNSFWMLLWENVMDPVVRDALRRDLGFCPKHTFGLGHVAVVGRSGGTPAFSILLCDFTDEAAKRITAEKRPHLAPDCSECRRHVETQATYAARLARHLRDASWAATVAERLTLCVPHHDMVLSHVKDERSQGRLVQTLSSPAVGKAAAPSHLAEMLFSQMRPQSVPATPHQDCPLCERVRSAADVDTIVGHDSSAVVCPRHLAELGAHLQEDMALRYAAALQAAITAREPPQLSLKSKDGVARPHCPVCDRLADLLGSNALDVRPQDAREHFLCVPHLAYALSVASPPDRQAMALAQARHLQALSAELDDYVRKSAWDHRDEPKGDEQTSWIRGTKCMAGEFLA